MKYDRLDMALAFIIGVASAVLFLLLLVPLTTHEKIKPATFNERFGEWEQQKNGSWEAKRIVYKMRYFNPMLKREVVL